MYLDVCKVWYTTYDDIISYGAKFEKFPSTCPNMTPNVLPCFESAKVFVHIWMFGCLICDALLVMHSDFIRNLLKNDI